MTKKTYSEIEAIKKTIHDDDLYTMKQMISTFGLSERTLIRRMKDYQVCPVDQVGNAFLYRGWDVKRLVRKYYMRESVLTKNKIKDTAKKGR